MSVVKDPILQYLRNKKLSTVWEEMNTLVLKTLSVSKTPQEAMSRIMENSQQLAGIVVSNIEVGAEISIISITIALVGLALVILSSIGFLPIVLIFPGILLMLTGLLGLLKKYLWERDPKLVFEYFRIYFQCLYFVGATSHELSPQEDRFVKKFFEALPFEEGEKNAIRCLVQNDLSAISRPLWLNQANAEALLGGCWALVNSNVMDMEKEMIAFRVAERLGIKKERAELLRDQVIKEIETSHGLLEYVGHICSVTMPEFDEQTTNQVADLLASLDMKGNANKVFKENLAKGASISLVSAALLGSPFTDRSITGAYILGKTLIGDDPERFRLFEKNLRSFGYAVKRGKEAEVNNTIADIVINTLMAEFKKLLPEDPLLAASFAKEGANKNQSLSRENMPKPTLKMATPKILPRPPEKKPPKTD